MSTRVGIEIATQIQVMISFTFGWHHETEGTGEPGPGHNNTGTADQTDTPGPASGDGETVGLAGGEAESHQVDIESVEEWRDSFVRITNGIIEEDDINSSDPGDNIEVDMDLDISSSLDPDPGHAGPGHMDTCLENGVASLQSSRVIAASLQPPAALSEDSFTSLRERRL